MPQDRDSGASANFWGRATARVVAEKIGAELVNEKRNEGIFQGSRISLHCASKKTDSIGVTYKTLERIDHVIGAFQTEDGSFEVRRLQREEFRSNMQATRSKGPSAGKVGQVKRSIFLEFGQFVAKVQLN